MQSSIGLYYFPDDLQLRSYKKRASVLDRCPACGGGGKVKCESCRGRGYNVEERKETCSTCGGKGYTVSDMTQTVHLPFGGQQTVGPVIYRTCSCSAFGTAGLLEVEQGDGLPKTSITKGCGWVIKRVEIPCSSCGGDGGITCSRCGGSKSIPRAQPRTDINFSSPPRQVPAWLQALAGNSVDEVGNPVSHATFGDR